MTKTTAAPNELLLEVRDILKKETNAPARAWAISKYLAEKHQIELDESTIRGRFIEMGQPLSGFIPVVKPTVAAPVAVAVVKAKATPILDELVGYIPKADEFQNYIERPVDKRLAAHYDAGKHPLTQGKQGTGKTFSHMYYAYKKQLPFFLFSMYEDFKLQKLFGDKTILNGSVVYQESIFVKAIQGPSVILADEINAVSNANTHDWHAFLQNRELFIKDANEGKGKIYKVHPECRLGFAQNPKSAKYIGGNIKPSSFLGRCTYITYPEFTEAEITAAIVKRYPKMDKAMVTKFAKFYFACCTTIENGKIPIDISIRQLNNVIDLYQSGGLPLKEAVEDGLTSMLEAASQPKAKEAFDMIAKATWPELLNPPITANKKPTTKNRADTLSCFLLNFSTRKG